MKNLLIVALIALGVTANAQLYVQPTATEASYVYVSDTFLFVEEDVELSENDNFLAESNVILRNDAQLLQGNGNGISANQDNKGSGNISIFQEGTVNAWDYNAWGSPVGISHDAAGAIEGDGNGRFAFKTPVSGTEQTVFTVPVSLTDANTVFATGAYNGSTMGTDGMNNSMLNIASYWIWAFKSGTGYANWEHIANTGDLEPGYGFTMKGINGTDTTDAGDGRPNNDGDLTNGIGQRYDFRGRPNNGTITINVGPGAEVLAANPYPSALDLDYFLLENSGSGTFNIPTLLADGVNTSANVNRTSVITGEAHFWDSNPNVFSHFLEEYQAGYGTYSPMLSVYNSGMYTNAVFYMYGENGEPTIPGGGTGDAYERRFSPVGQGFFLEGAASGDQASQSISFNNDQRIFVKEGTNSDFRSVQTESDVIPGIGVSTYYPDVNNMISYPKVKIGVGINDTYSRELGIGILKHATAGYDVAGDAKSGDNLGADVSFEINEENNFVINAIPDDVNIWLPLSIKANATTEYKFKVHFTENFSYPGVYLVDRLTETYYDILEEEVLMMLEAGVYNDRYYIRFTREPISNNATEEDNTTTEEEEEEEEEREEITTTAPTDETEEISVTEESPFIQESILESFTILQNNNAGQLEIYNPQSIVLDNVTLFDITGKQIFAEQDLGNQEVFTFPTRRLSTGVYIVKFYTEEGLAKGRKISVTNN